MYRLHFAPDNASLIVRLALEELGLPYQAVLVDRSRQEQRGAAFRALNPAGRIPALETPQGPLFETAAILLALADASGRLAPPPGDAARGAFLSWLFFLSNTLHADLRMVFYPEDYAGPDPAAQQVLHDMLTARLSAHFDLVEDLARAGHGWFNAPDPGCLDLYVAVLMRWAQLYARRGTGWFDPARYPALCVLAARLEARPATQACALAEGLGDTPFTAPRRPTPPLGRVM